MQLAGKKALITGIANQYSLAHSIAAALAAQGAEVGLAYQNAKLLKWVEPIAKTLNAKFIHECDVSHDADLASLKDEIGRHWQKLDILIHSVAFADLDELGKKFRDISRAGFARSLDVSSYSLIALANAVHPFMKDGGGSIVTLTYHGSQKVMPGYGLMGVAKAALESTVRYLAHDLGPDKIRVNAISPGPVKTFSSAAFPNFRDVIERVREETPLKENIDPGEVGALAAYLCGDGARHLTGSTLYLDSGAHIMGA